MAGKIFVLATAVVAMAAFIPSSAAQTTYVVGDSLGWLVPPGGPIAYETWASSYTFKVGDILMFNFTTGEQDVAQVTKEAFDSCNSTSPMWLQTNGPYNFTLESAGSYYFIGTMDRHCALGQKLAINVTSSSPTPSPPPSSPPQAPAPTPPRAAMTYIVGDDLGWIVPPGGPIAYETWAYGKLFVVGDTLVFNFTTGEQDVAQVTKEAFDSCNSTSPMWLQTNGPYNFTLESAGSYYFIGTMDRHCALGQKLAINVTSSSPTPSPPPSSPPQAPAPTPPRAAMTYIVGDDLGWIVPPGGPIAYETWAYGKLFVVGDTLVFNFTTGEQDVARVTKEAFENCNTTNPISLETTGPFNYTLETPGEYFFIGTMDRHCTLGQKLAINVTSSTSQSPSSPPKASTPTTPRAPLTYFVGDELEWIVPPGGPIAYETWAYRKTFLVGDVLVFIFENGTQDVARVTKEAYESCNTNTTISISTTSPTNITLTSLGEYFFTSTYPRHCLLGQKLAINVTSTTSGSTSSSAPSPTAGGPATAPPPESAAPSRVIFGFSSILVALAIAHLF